MPEPQADQEFLSLPSQVAVHLVTTADELVLARAAILEADVVGIDVEWASDAAEPSASLVQLAVRRGRDEDVFILDLLQLEQQAVYSVLQSLFRSRQTLKVGFGLKGDLWAIAQALPDGANCIVVVNTVLEMKLLQQHLLRSGLITQSGGQGLAALVASQLGRTLDKRLQCSSWGLRPLSSEQVHYAALDAHCLLQLLDSWVALVPPSRYPMYEDAQPAAAALCSPSSDPAVVPPDAEQQSATIAGSGAGSADQADAQRVPEGSEQGRQLLGNHALPGCESEGQQPAAALGAGDERGSELRPQSTASAHDAALAGSMQSLRLSSAVGQLSAQQPRPSAADVASEDNGGPAGLASRAADEAASSMTNRQYDVTAHSRAAHGGSAAGRIREGIDAEVRQLRTGAADEAAVQPRRVIPVRQTEAEGKRDGGAAASEAAEGQEGTWQAAQYWSCRLELLTRSRQRPARKHKSNARQRKAPSRSQAVATEMGFPSVVPWGEDPPRFVADVMCEGLARQLRMVGVDTVCALPPPKHNRHHVHRWLISTAQDEDRVILTSDRFLITAAISERAYFVRSSTKLQQLPEVLEAFDISPSARDLLSRCVKCNGNFLPRAVPLAELAPEQRPPEGICRLHAKFWACAVCGKAYWKGSQYANARQQLSTRLRL